MISSMAGTGLIKRMFFTFLAVQTERSLISTKWREEESGLSAMKSRTQIKKSYKQGVLNWNQTFLDDNFLSCMVVLKSILLNYHFWQNHQKKLHLGSSFHSQSLPVAAGLVPPFLNCSTPANTLTLGGVLLYKSFPQNIPNKTGSFLFLLHTREHPHLGFWCFSMIRVFHRILIN